MAAGDSGGEQPTSDPVRKWFVRRTRSAESESHAADLTDSQVHKPGHRLKKLRTLLSGLKGETSRPEAHDDSSQS